MPRYAPNKTPWSKGEKQFLKEYFFKLTLNELLIQVNTMRKDPATYQELRHQLNRMKLKRFNIIHWTEQQTSYLIEKYATMGNREIAEKLNKMKLSTRRFNAKAIEKKMNLLGIKRTNEMLDVIRQGHKVNKRYPGNVNGLKNGHEKICNIGGVPHWHVKVNGIFRKKSVLLWEERFGKIPSGHMVAFIDDNSLNCELHNLELVKIGRYTDERKRRIIRNANSYFEKVQHNKQLERIRQQEEKELEAKKPMAPTQNKVKVQINPKLAIWVKPGTDVNAIRRKYGTAI